MIYIYLFLIAANCLLGWLIFYKHRTNPANISFFLGALGIAAWIASVYLVHNSTNILFWTRVSFVIASIIPPFILMFALFYPRKFSGLNGWILGLIWIPPIWMIGLSVTPAIVQSAPTFSTTAYGIGCPIFAVYFLSYVAGIVGVAMAQIRLHRGIYAMRLQYFIAGTILSGFSCAAASIILPMVGYTEFDQFSPLFTSFLVITTFIAITRHRLVEIPIMISRSVALATTAAFYIFISFSSVYIFHQFSSRRSDALFLLFQILYTSVIILTFQKVRYVIQTSSDSLFLKGRYNYQEVLKKVSHRLTGCVSLADLLDVLLDLFRKELEMPLVLYVEDRRSHFVSQNFYLAGKNVGSSIALPDTLDESDPLVSRLLSEKKVILSSEFDCTLREYLKENRISLAVPGILENQLLCFLALEKKYSGDAYSLQDITLLETLASHITVVYERVRVFEHLQQLNQENKELLQTLEKRVAQQVKEIEETLKLAAVTKTVITLNHEINSPLTSILLGAQQLTQEANLDPKLVWVSRIIAEQAKKIGVILYALRRITAVSQEEYLPGVPMLKFEHKGKTRFKAQTVGDNIQRGSEPPHPTSL